MKKDINVTIPVVKQGRFLKTYHRAAMNVFKEHPELINMVDSLGLRYGSTYDGKWSFGDGELLESDKVPKGLDKLNNDFFDLFYKLNHEKDFEYYVESCFFNRDSICLVEDLYPSLFNLNVSQGTLSTIKHGCEAVGLKEVGYKGGFIKPFEVCRINHKLNLY